MPDRWAVSAGNWSSTATWNGGTLPQAGDDVFADGFTVTIDQNVNVLSIRTTQRSGGTAGGGFTLNTGFNVTGNVISGTTTCLSISTASGTHTITGNVTGGTQAVNNGAINKSGNSAMIVVGNIVGGTGNNTHGVNITSGGGVTITGNVTGGTGFATNGIRWVGGAFLIVNGDVIGSSNSSSAGISVGLTSHVLTVTGTINNGSGYQAAGIVYGPGVTGTSTINGNVIATTSGQGSIILHETTANVFITINGNVTATATSTIASMSSGGSVAATNTSTIVVNGNVTSSGPFSAITHLTPNGFVIVNGNIFSHTTGNVPIAAYRILLHPSTTMQHEYRVNNAGSPGVARSLYTGGVNLNQPAVSNVRSGIVYGAASEFTGTCAVPPAASVAVGVPVDNTVGTAVITAAGVRSAVGLASANLDTQLSGIATKTSQLNFTTPGQVDANSLTGGLTQAQVRSAVGLAAANLDTQLSGLSSDIGNIEVDNAAIASAVQSQLDDDFASLASAIGEIDPAAVTVAPLSATRPTKVRGSNIETYVGDTDPIRIAIWSGASGTTPVDLASLRPLTMVIADKTSRAVIQTIADGDLDIDTTNYLTFTPSVLAVEEEAIHRWSLRKANGAVIGRGDFQVFWEPIEETE